METLFSAIDAVSRFRNNCQPYMATTRFVKSDSHSAQFSRVPKHGAIIERIINVWNFLPHAVDFSSLSKCKRSLNRVDFSAFLRYA